MGDLRAKVGNLNLSTNPFDMYECDAPISKRTRVRLFFNLFHVDVVHLTSGERIWLLPLASIPISLLCFRTLGGVVSSLPALETSNVT